VQRRFTVVQRMSLVLHGRGRHPGAMGTPVWTSKALLGLGALAATWGASYLFIAVALRTSTPGMLTFLRFAPAAVLVAYVAWRRGGRPSQLRGLWGRVAVLALFQQAGPMLLIAVGEQSIASGLAGTLVAAAPLWAAVLAPALGRPAPSATTWTGLVVGIAGVGLLLGADTDGARLVGAGLVLLAALGYAVGSAWTVAWFAGVPRETLLAAGLAASSLWLLPPALLDPPTRLPDLAGALSIAALGLLGTGAAYLVLYWLFGQVGPERALLVTYLAPGFAVFYGAVLLDEQVTAVSLGGLVLVLAGAWLAGRSPRVRRPVERVPAPA
jgi:drug/metabolite transporter (DMT)-like permease